MIELTHNDNDVCMWSVAFDKTAHKPLITARKRSLGQGVFFLYLSVILSTDGGGGGRVMGGGTRAWGHARQGGGHAWQRGMRGRDGVGGTCVLGQSITILDNIFSRSNYWRNR